MRIFQRTYKDKHGQTKTGKTWWVTFYVAGRRFHESLRTRDKRAAQLVAADRVRQEELKRAGIVDPYGESHEKPLAEHLADFEKTIRARGVVKKYLEDRMGCLKAYVEQTGARKLKDLDLPRASGFLTEISATGVSARTVNRYYQAIKQFGLWLVRTRRSQFNPFDGLRPRDEKADRRHVRRALTPEEAERLLEAARTRPLKQAEEQRVHAGVTPKERLRLTRLGEIRALVYGVALGTGLRKSEIRRLRWCDIDFDEERLTIPAASAKSRREQVIDVNRGVLDMLRDARPTDAGPQDAIVPPRTFPNTLTFHKDLELAGIERRDASDRVVDFHALRTTHISWLAMTGAHPRVAQALARHASIETTMERYTDLTLVGTREAVEKLPLLGGKNRRVHINARRSAHE